MIKQFEEYLKSGIIRKQQPDFKRAESLHKEALERKQFFDKVMNKLPFKEVDPNFIIESSYDIIMELIRAKLFMQGFVSDSSHEAEVSYMREIGFSEKQVDFMDQLRFFRNGILYYGKRFDKEYALKVIEYTKEVYNKLRKL